MGKTSQPEIPPLALASATCEACQSPKQPGVAFCRPCIYRLLSVNLRAPFNYMEALYHLQDLIKDEKLGQVQARIGTPTRCFLRSVCDKLRNFLTRSKQGARVSTRINIIKGEERQRFLYVAQTSPGLWDGWTFVRGERVHMAARKTREELIEWAREGAWEVVEI